MENMFNGVNILEYSKRFTCDEDCVAYLGELKWDKGFPNMQDRFGRRALMLIGSLGPE